MNAESASITAIKLTRQVFESVYGNVGLLRFAVEELTPTNGSATTESKKWKIICSLFESLGSTEPSRYEVNVDLVSKEVGIKKIQGAGNPTLEGSWTFKKDKK